MISNEESEFEIGIGRREGDRQMMARGVNSSGEGTGAGELS